MHYASRVVRHVIRKKHKEKFNKNLIKYLYISTFFLGIASAFVLYLESDYFKVGFKSENITPFFLTAYGIALVLMLNWHHLVRLLGKKRVFQLSLGVKLTLCFFLMLLPVSFGTVWLLVLYITFTVISWLDMDILLETCSVDRKTGKIRGLYLTIENTGYLVAPFFSGLLVSRFGFQAAFAVSFALLFLVFLLVSVKIENVDHCPLKKTRLIPMLKKIFVRKNIMKAYYISFLLELFYALMIIYTPLYLLDLGFDWFQIGKIFTVMLVPFVLLQYPAGYLADTKWEERDMMAVALFVMGFSTLAIYFLETAGAAVWAIVLFLTRVGASLIEILRDSYFYKRIDQSDVDITDFFRTVRPVAYILGSLAVAPIVFAFHIKFIFLFVGFAVLTGIPVSASLASSRSQS